ncbi:MAG: AAA family ATPase [Chloroflexi bacterium]|nr:AAA family ATPase [Chloroflexota bacterium]MYD49643.1 AAA family ATPase [Chloroflexota bacterium]
MITSVRMVNFKNFADETLKVGPFTVIVGANASGKSNIRDAFRFLHGIGRGYTLAEILGGRYGPGGQREWAGIRGAPNEILRMCPASPGVPFWFSLGVELDSVETKTSYSIKVAFAPDSPDGFRLMDEELRVGLELVYKTVESHDSLLKLPADDTGKSWIELSRSQPALAQLSTTYSWRNLNARREFNNVLGKIRYLEFMPERMREPSITGASMLGDSGENLPSVLEAICADPQRGRNLMSWLQELTPMDVKDFDFPRDPSGRVHLHIVERNGRKVSAYSASDGTLRFLGILAALLGPNEGGLYFFEEIDNGIHPNRLWLLLDLIEQQTAEGNIQVVTTTHSPALLAWMSDTAFENTSVVYRDQYWADSVIRPIAGLFNLRELREAKGLERLLTSGWFETAMKFSEGDSDSDHLDDDEDDWEQGVLE